MRVRARVETIHGFSAHAGRGELLKWLSAFEEKPRRVFVTHGEDDSREAFAELIGESLQYETMRPDYLETVVLD